MENIKVMLVDGGVGRNVRAVPPVTNSLVECGQDCNKDGLTMWRRKSENTLFAKPMLHLSL